MYSKTKPNHLVCENCGADFPQAWLKARKAVKEGEGRAARHFCCPLCRDEFYDDGHTSS